MQKIRNKIITTLTIVALLMVQFAPTLVYASAEIKSNATNQENVKFDATISNGYSAVFDIEGEATLDLAISVENVGYLKDCKITLEGNNYQIAKPDNKYVKSVANNTVELNEIKTGEIAEISIPIKAVKENVIGNCMLTPDESVYRVKKIFDYNDLSLKPENTDSQTNAIEQALANDITYITLI